MDNTTDVECAHANLKEKRAKKFDMRHHWIKDRASQDHFNVHWRRRLKNLADYFTKHFPSPHHIKMRSLNVQDAVKNKKHSE